MKNDPHVTEVSDDGALLKRYRNEIVDLKQRLQEVGIIFFILFFFPTQVLSFVCLLAIFLTTALSDSFVISHRLLWSHRPQ